jgi:hypothetical protein
MKNLILLSAFILFVTGRASLSALTLQEMGYTNVHAITAKFEDIKNALG